MANSKPARVLPPEEAAREKARHEKMVEALAPTEAYSEEKLRAFVESHKEVRSPTSRKESGSSVDGSG